MTAPAPAASVRPFAIDWRQAQTRLGIVDDGAAGPVTYAALLVHVAGHAVPLAPALGAALAVYLPASAIDATPDRLAGFLGQCCHESWGYTRLRELWGPTPAQRGYEYRRDLGNTQPGDGARFRGRGMIQITGRANYGMMGAALDLPLVATPELAERPEVAVLTAIEFWRRGGLNAVADRGDWATVTRRINGGLTALDERVRCIARARAIIA